MNCLRRSIRCDFLNSTHDPILLPDQHHLDLQLLHHFTVSTASTLSPETSIRDSWRLIVPQLGFSKDYILDGILALAALHMARYNSGRRDELQSYAYQRHAASLSKALPLMSNVNPHNCSHLFIFGLLTLYFDVAKPIGVDDFLVTAKGAAPEWLPLLRGIDSIVHKDNTILESPISPILQATAAALSYWRTHSPVDIEVLEELRQKIEAKAASFDPERHDALQDAILLLKRSYTFFYAKTFQENDRFTGFYTWMLEVSDQYLELLRNRNNEAMCILAFYCVLMRDAEKYWWWNGWSIHIIQRIYLFLDAEYRLWIQWPIEEIGWVTERAIY